MSKSKISLESFSKDLNDILDLVSKVENLDFENLKEIELNKISKEIKKTDKFIKKKYKNLDSSK